MKYLFNRQDKMAGASAVEGAVEDIVSSEEGNSSRLTVQEKICCAVELKNEGNEFFKKQQFRDAMKKYHRAILHVKGLGDELALKFAVQGSENISEEDKLKIDEIMCSCCNNLAGNYASQSGPGKVAHVILSSSHSWPPGPRPQTAV